MKRRRKTEGNLRIPEIIGVPKRGIIFSDLDGVWFDEGNNFAAPTPSDLAVLEEARNAGYWLVLNSDTGTDALASFARALNFDPLVIGENGAVVYLPKMQLKQYLSPLKPFFYGLRQEVIQQLMTRFEASIFIGDATSYLRETDRVDFPPGTAYLVNATRECSFGVYTRVIDENGLLTVKNDQTQITEELLNKLLAGKPETRRLTCKRYPKLGSCLVKDPTIQKSQAVKWIIDQFPTDITYYMIGDSPNDSMETMADRVTTCAVGNADEKLKGVALRSGGTVAPANLTLAKGANYIIEQILAKGGN